MDDRDIEDICGLIFLAIVAAIVTFGYLAPKDW
jgi:hypothetical protein